MDKKEMKEVLIRLLEQLLDKVKLEHVEVNDCNVNVGQDSAEVDFQTLDEAINAEGYVHRKRTGKISYGMSIELYDPNMDELINGIE